MNSDTGAVEVVERATYKPFGEQNEWLNTTSPPTAPETKGWIGERYDADAGLQYLNARYYDPVLGMFLQPDWFEVTKAGVGTNRYSYSFNDPVNKIDPGGNQAKEKEVEEKEKKSRKTVEKVKTPGGPAANDNWKPKRLIRKLAQSIGALGLLKRAWDISEDLEEYNNENSKLYRGLSKTDVDSMLKKGAVYPKNVDGNKTPEEHALSSDDSQYVSLTTDQGTAEYFATGGIYGSAEASGVVAVYDGQNLLFGGGLVGHEASSYGPEAAANVANESEVLHLGPVPNFALEELYYAPAPSGFIYYQGD